jgi:hypothetical protein
MFHRISILFTQDVSQVKKFTLTDEEYDKRANTYRAFKVQYLFFLLDLNNLKILIHTCFHLKFFHGSIISAQKKQIAEDPDWKSIYASRAEAAQAARRAHEAAQGGASGSASVSETPEAIHARIKVGQRCSVFPGDRRGEACMLGQSFLV